MEAPTELFSQKPVFEIFKRQVFLQVVAWIWRRALYVTVPVNKNRHDFARITGNNIAKPPVISHLVH